MSETVTGLTLHGSPTWKHTAEDLFIMQLTRKHGNILLETSNRKDLFYFFSALRHTKLYPKDDLSEFNMNIFTWSLLTRFTLYGEVCAAWPCVCASHVLTDLGWRCLEWQQRPLGLDSPTGPPGFQPELAWPGSAPSSSSAPGTREHRVQSSQWLAARRTPRASDSKNNSKNSMNNLHIRNCH